MCLSATSTRKGQEEHMQGSISLKGTRRKVVATIGALAIVAGGTGVAVAATGVGTPQEESTAVIAAAAEDLGVRRPSSAGRSSRLSGSESTPRSRRGG